MRTLTSRCGCRLQVRKRTAGGARGSHRDMGGDPSQESEASVVRRRPQRRIPVRAGYVSPQGTMTHRDGTPSRKCGPCLPVFGTRVYFPRSSPPKLTSTSDHDSLSSFYIVNRRHPRPIKRSIQESTPQTLEVHPEQTRVRRRRLDAIPRCRKEVQGQVSSTGPLFGP